MTLIPHCVDCGRRWRFRDFFTVRIDMCPFWADERGYSMIRHHWTRRHGPTENETS